MLRLTILSLHMLTIQFKFKIYFSEISRHNVVEDRQKWLFSCMKCDCDVVNLWIFCEIYVTIYNIYRNHHQHNAKGKILYSYNFHIHNYNISVLSSYIHIYYKDLKYSACEYRMVHSRFLKWQVLRHNVVNIHQKWPFSCMKCDFVVLWIFSGKYVTLCNTSIIKYQHSMQSKIVYRLCMLVYVIYCYLGACMKVIYCTIWEDWSLVQFYLQCL